MAVPVFVSNDNYCGYEVYGEPREWQRWGSFTQFGHVDR